MARLSPGFNGGSMQGDTIYFLSDYSWFCGTVISKGPKNFKILVPAQRWFKEHIATISADKCANPEELVCVVWEKWKGKNGRGGYRVERGLYPSSRVPGRGVHYQHCNYNAKGRVDETAYGILA